ncbi:MAG TPA: folylpolyglutamate synthase/dihydrofolate synthase family protein [Dissulfurispiraceae bacterium]|nr:folylpolyglutamate synthase/dihydrofolate synthase family protein [Dissulfurispiraceae bacterium]
MSYTGAIKYLYDLQRHSIKLGLERTEKILAVLGNPHRRFLSVHVAGTNGKGSVAAMVASMLMSDGFRVGLFTSPHMVSFTERIRINGSKISETEVGQLTGEIKEKISALAATAGEPTFFEFVTVMAFLYFARNNVDWSVIEVGMGGRLDATNLILPEVSVITGISYDHREFLGNTLSDIASEKAGIIKKGVPVVCSVQEPEVELILRKKADAASSPFFIYGKDFSGDLRSTDITGTRFDYNSESHAFSDLQIPLAGEHQVINACVAVQAFLLCRAHSTPEAVREGLAAVRWQGRLELVNGAPPIILDGAHNPHASSALAEFIRRQFINYRVILIAGIMSDKDIAGILAPLLTLASDIIFTAPNYGRSASPGVLAEHAASLGFQSSVTLSIREAIALAQKIAFSPQSNLSVPAVILITGSFFTIGEVKELLGERAVLGDLRENYNRA